MIITSDAWKKLIQSEDLLPESNINLVSNNDIEDTSQNWNITSSDAEDISDKNVLLSSSGTINRNTTKIATLEWNFWILDGTYKVPTEDTKMNGYVSKETSNADGLFENSVEIELTGNENVSKKLMTLKFAPDINEYATSCSVVNGANLEETTSNMFDEPEEYHYANVSETSTKNLTLLIHEWSMPYRKVRINELLLGARLFFDKSMLSSFKHQRTGDMVNAELPQNDCTFNVLDINNEYDIDNTNAKFAKMISADTTFNLYYGYKIDNSWEYHLVDCFYLETFERPKNGIEAKFTLESNLNRKNQTFNSNENVVFYTYGGLIDKISNKMGVRISRVGGNYATTYKAFLYLGLRQALGKDFFTIPMNEWLQQVACVINGYIFRTSNGLFEVRGITNKLGEIINTTTIDSVPLLNCFNYPEIESVNLLSRIVLTTTPINSEQQNNPDSETNIEVGGETLTFPPYRFRGSGHEGGTELTAQNKIIVFGSAGTNENNFTVDDELHKSYLQWLFSFLSASKKIKTNMRINPAWQIGDLIEIEQKNGTFIKGFIVDIDIEYAGYPKGNLTILSPYQFNS